MRKFSGEREEGEHLVDVPVEIGKSVIAALDQLDSGRGAAGRHFAPVQHLVALGDHREIVFRMAKGAMFQGSQFGHEPGLEEEPVLWLVPGGLLADGTRQVAGRTTAGLSSTARHPSVSATWMA